MSSNTSVRATAPELSCSLHPQPPLLPFISDEHLSIVLPTVVYIISSAFFHFLDAYNFLSSYRIHPSEDVLKRNHVTRWQCLKQVAGYHAMQITIGLALSWGEGPTMIESEACGIYNWAGRIRRLRNLVSMLLNILGIDAKGLAGAVRGISEGLAQVFTGDLYLFGQVLEKNPGITPLEVLLAKTIFHIGIPALQYFVALAVVDTWIYFTHRLCHINKTLYRIVHARHHLLYISYAYGAVYAHPLESLFLDIVSFVLANAIAQLTPRQSMLFGSFAVIKTISDHCGYVFPYDPFLAVNANGAKFHDLHHQSWGLKNNFSTYTTFWDNLLGTAWSDGEGAQRRYERVWEATKARGLNGKGEGVGVMNRDGERKVAKATQI
ncbi:MAG: hypothetical protein Q9217_006731 [Psora testacea]